MKTGAERIAAERRRQMEEEGWDSDHDDSHHGGELALAAAAYAAAPQRLYQKVERRDVVSFRDAWPWEPGWDKRDKHGEIRRLEIAGALIAAEIDRLLRAVYTKTAEVEDD
ncbi:MAG: hypothetical protein GWN53_17140 [Gammaproteobacteria bacterium]|uniref:Uncharacterized protein n=1 Tax=Candidatus Kutchimonas denitrificans TaxID=3056748 RepID=A0AAE5CD76_9BACT|nr:hypothetical protein [Candidatus Kutchimonas denitrificans]NIV53567.1 hypothetical protein [Gammaproteobacteria bacterium]